MATTPQYRGILFPDRAGSLEEFDGYKVFLEPWEPLAETLRRYYEGLALRRETRVLAVHGPRASGKTLFARKLVADLKTSKEQAPALVPDPNNLWHRVAGGPDLDAASIAHSASSADLLHIAAR